MNRLFYLSCFCSAGCSLKVPSMVLFSLFSVIGNGFILLRIIWVRWLRNGGMRQSMPIRSEHSPGIISSMLAMDVMNPSNNGVQVMLPCENCSLILLNVRKPLSLNMVMPIMAVIIIISMVFIIPMLLLV